MKARIVISMLMLLVGINGALANKNGEVNEKVLSSFQKEFSTACEVTWQNSGQFSKVSFTLNEQVFTAYYTENGDRIAIARNLRSLELPMGLLSSLKKSYSNCWITDLFEIHSEQESGYYVTVENADYRITLRSTGLSDWDIYKKLEKE